MSPPTLVVDTNVFAAVLGKDPHGLVKTYSPDLTGSRLVVSFQTVAELRYGAMAANWGQTRVEAMEERLERAVAIPPHDELVTEWARLRLDCRQAGHPLQDKAHHADLWIAATARLVDVPLVTHDRVFRETPGLHVICHVSRFNPHSTRPAQQPNSPTPTSPPPPHLVPHRGRESGRGLRASSACDDRTKFRPVPVLSSRDGRQM